MIQNRIKDYISHPMLLRFISLVSFVILRLCCFLNRFHTNISGFFGKMMAYSSEQSGRRYVRAAKWIARYSAAEDLNVRMTQFLNRHQCQVPASWNAGLILRNYYHDHNVLPEWKLHNKVAGSQFVNRLGVKAPFLYQKCIPFSAIQPRDHIVLKPLNMYYGKGVFFVRSSRHITELNSKKVFESWEALGQYVDKLLKSAYIEDDIWMVEELIIDGESKIPTDLKFNMFYGQVGWIAAIDRLAGPRYHIMDRDGETINSGLYRKDQLYVGPKVKKEHFELAIKISLEIPTPCMRIDFLRKDDELVFGEFTPISGAAGWFPKKLDNQYGRFYYEAEARLFHDLLNGKKFETYHALLSDSY